MLNKKAIAAFAAGATLLSGMAFAAPAFAAEPAKDPKAEKCATAQDNVNDAKAALATAQANSVLAGDTKTAAHKKLDKATGLVNAYKEALKDVKAKEAAYTDAEDKDAARSELTKSVKKLNEALKNINDNKGDNKTFPAATAVPDDVTVGDGNGTVTYGTATKDSFKAALEGLATKQADEAAQKAEDAVSAAQDKLDLAKIHLTNLGCQASGSEQNPPKHDPTTPTQPGSVKDADAAKADVMVKAAAYDAARVKNAAAKAEAQKAYEEAAKAKKADEAAQAEVDAAQKAVDLFAGDKTSKEYKDLNDRLDRAKAKKTFTENTFEAAAAKYAEKQAAFDAANAEAQKAYDAYKAAVNVAAAFGVDVTKLPVVVAMDPLDKTFPGFADAQQLYRDAQSGKFGPAAAAAAKGAANGAAAAAADKKADKQGKITVEKGKDKAGKNLPKTGAAIALTALAASVLAGMGAAVRKVRH
ncbi:hypothetical protein [Gardnerella sp. 2492-Sm]|uniref:hypothetical protein n=1 Tax=unclassified Gardnerella TaxID=2628112 RepID=UPI003D01B0AC